MVTFYYWEDDFFSVHKETRGSEKDSLKWRGNVVSSTVVQHHNCLLGELGIGYVFFPYVIFGTQLRWLVILQEWSKIQKIVLGQGGALGN